MMQLNEVFKSRKEDISELKQKKNLYLDCHLIPGSNFKKIWIKLLL